MYLKVLLIFSFIAVSGVHWFNPGSKSRNAIYQAPPKNLSNYHFDYADMISSVFWVRLLQDMEVCDQRRERDLAPVLDGGEAVIEQILSRKLPESKCHLSWVYKMVDVVTDLAPTFYMAYDVGGLFLSVLVDDREGAQRIYQKGIKYFPERWELLYKSAYHSLFEMQKPEEAAALLHQAGRHGGPKFVYSLAARLYTKTGQAQFAKTMLENVLARKPKGPGVNKVEARLKKINEYLSNPPKSQ